MTRYDAFAADQYMRSVLTDELSDDETDNALSALTTLTIIHPSLFPHDRTFVRPDHQQGVDGPSGVRFVVYGDEGIERMLRLPRRDLTSISETIDRLVDLLRTYVETPAA